MIGQQEPRVSGLPFPERIVRGDRALDQRIAERLGWRDIQDYGHGWLLGHPTEERMPQLREVPHYTSDIRAAWTLMEWMMAQGWELDISWSHGVWQCEASHLAQDDGFVLQEGETAEMAISLTASSIQEEL